MSFILTRKYSYLNLIFYDYIQTNLFSLQQAFFTGKFKIKGNVMLSQKLQHLFNSKPKL